MKFILSLMMLSLLHSNTPWLTNFEKAKDEAAGSHKLIVLNFSGSDWCIPCMRLHKDIFESEVFRKYAEDNLVLVNADFPRLKKNQLPKELSKQNDALADQYNPHGNFPLTLLLDAQGKVLKEWEGYPNETPDKFLTEIDEVVHANSDSK